MTVSCWTLSRRKIRQNKRYSANKPAGRKTCRFFVILRPTFLVGAEQGPEMIVSLRGAKRRGNLLISPPHPRPPLLRGGCQPNRLTGGVRENATFLPPALRATPLVNAGGKRTDSHGPNGPRNGMQHKKSPSNRRGLHSYCSTFARRSRRRSLRSPVVREKRSSSGTRMMQIRAAVKPPLYRQ